MQQKYFSVRIALVAMLYLFTGIAYAHGLLDVGGVMAIGPMGAIALGAGGGLSWQRIRDKGVTFDNVPTSNGTGKATLEIPRYMRTLYAIQLRLGGTAFTKAMITAIRLKLESKTVSQWTGANLDKIQRYNVLAYHDNFLTIDFTNQYDKNMPDELVPGLCLANFPAGRVYLEVDISGATAPTLTAQLTWGPKQENNFVKRVMEYSGALSVAGAQNNVRIDTETLGRADVQRMYIVYEGNDWCGTSATAAAWSGNTGNGTCGAVTVSAGAKVGTHKIVIAEPGTNVGTFIHFDPEGKIVSAKGAVASAYSGGGLAFTLADGSTDFVAGDGFDIPVGLNTDGNVNHVEVKKDGVTVFERTCIEARQEQQRYGFVPQSKMFVVDFCVERNRLGTLVTADAKSLEFLLTPTATDSYKIYLETLQDAASI